MHSWKIVEKSKKLINTQLETIPLRRRIKEIGKVHMTLERYWDDRCGAHLSSQHLGG
jgi:hypothetical protein